MGEGYFDFTAGAPLSAANLEDYCETQSIMRFATTAIRDAQLTSVKTNGTTCYITATNEFYVYDGTTWQAFSSRYKTVSFSPGTPVAGATSETTRFNACSLAIPAQPVAGTLHITAVTQVDNQVAGDGFYYEITVNGADVALPITKIALAGVYFLTASCSAPLAANTAATILVGLLRTFGTGWVVTTANSQINRIDAMFTPT
jgi:hypothetical protein